MLLLPVPLFSASPISNPVNTEISRAAISTNRKNRLIFFGWRGASRYYDPKYTDAFRLELKAVRKVREEYGLKNLNCMIPFCRTVDEAEKVTAIMREVRTGTRPDFKLLLMAEIPANILLADRFNKFVDGYSIGSNDFNNAYSGLRQK